MRFRVSLMSFEIDHRRTSPPDGARAERIIFLWAMDLEGGRGMRPSRAPAGIVICMGFFLFCFDAYVNFVLTFLFARRGKSRRPRI